MNDVTFDLSAFANSININLKTVVRKITADLLTKIVKRTPVDTGRARASWNIGIGGPDTTVPAEGKHSGNTSITSITAIDGNETVWISSNLDYIAHLEQGTSKQAPAGMVEISIAEIEVEIDAFIASLV